MTRLNGMSGPETEVLKRAKKRAPRRRASPEAGADTVPADVQPPVRDAAADARHSEQEIERLASELAKQMEEAKAKIDGDLEVARGRAEELGIVDTAESEEVAYERRLDDQSPRAPRARRARRVASKQPRPVDRDAVGGKPSWLKDLLEDDFNVRPEGQRRDNVARFPQLLDDEKRHLKPGTSADFIRNRVAGFKKTWKRIFGGE